LLEKVIKVSLISTNDKGLEANPRALTRCAKCISGMIELKEGVGVKCNMCQKALTVPMETDKLERILQKCPFCDIYMVNVIKGGQSKGIECLLCKKEKKKEEEKVSKELKKAQQEEEKDKGEEKEYKKENEVIKKQKKKKKKKREEIPVIVNPSTPINKPT